MRMPYVPGQPPTVGSQLKIAEVALNSHLKLCTPTDSPALYLEHLRSQSIDESQNDKLLGHFDISGLHSDGWNEAKFVFTGSSGIGDGNVDENSDERLYIQKLKGTKVEDKLIRYKA